MLQPRVLELMARHCRAESWTRYQRIDISQFETGTTLIVLAGALGIESQIDADRRQIVAIAFPGEALELDAFASLTGGAIRPLGQARLNRLLVSVSAEGSRFETSRADLELLSHHIAEATQRFYQRHAAHPALVGRLSSEERVATLLLQLSGMAAFATSSGTVLTVPFSRTDMADYLCVNADTLSRVLSRIEGQGLIEKRGRNEFHILQTERLRQMCPLHGGPGEPSVGHHIDRLSS